MATGSELPIDRNATATEMAEEIFGDGVTVTSATYTGHDRSSGIYSDGYATSPGVMPADTGVILSTGRVDDFTNSRGDPNRSSGRSRDMNGEDNDADFNAAAGTNTYDAAFLEIEFTPTGDSMTLDFVFASDEYPEYTNSVFQDIVGVWVNGTLVPLGVGDGDTDPGNVNSTNNQNLYNDNTGDQYNTEMDGFTVTLTLSMDVIAGATNTLKIGIADVSDASYDSSILIGGNSAQTALVTEDDYKTLTANETKTVDVLSNDTNTGGTLTITHINGIAVVAGDTVVLTTGQSVTLNANGTLEMTGDGTAEDFNFTYTATNGTNSDTGFVHVSSIPCFVAGTRISTPEGEVAVEDLTPGDMVTTIDDGAQPVRWVGRRKVEAKGDFAPIRISENALGEHGELLLSPQHRVLIEDARADLWFGESEVLVAAKDLVNDSTIHRQSGGIVEYVHILFDKHQVVYSEGLASESFLPGPQTTKSFEQPMVKEITTLFPELDLQTGSGYSPSARRTLRAYEAEVLFDRPRLN